MIDRLKRHLDRFSRDHGCDQHADRPDRHCSVCSNKAATDRRLRPRCCHPGSYFKRPKSSPVRPLTLQPVLLRTVYCQTQGCLCTALQLGGDVEQPWLMSKYDVCVLWNGDIADDLESPPNRPKPPHFLHFAPPFIASKRVNLETSNLVH